MLWADRTFESLETIRKTDHKLKKDNRRREGNQRVKSQVEFELNLQAGETCDLSSLGEIVKRTSKSEVRKLSGQEVRDLLGLPETIHNAKSGGPYFLPAGRPAWPYAYTAVAIDSATVTKTNKRESTIVRFEFSTYAIGQSFQYVVTCWKDHAPWDSWFPSRSYPDYNKLYLVSHEELERFRVKTFEMWQMEEGEAKIARTQRSARLESLVQQGLATKTFDYEEGINVLYGR